MQRPIEVMGEGLGHPEGPDMLPDGRVVFVETYTSDVKVWEEGKGISVYGYCGGGTNACIVGGDGDVYVTQNGGTVGAWRAPEMVTPSIQRIKPDGTVSYVATEIDGIPLGAPNDLAFGPNGSLYFTDSGEWDPVNRPDPSRIFELFPDGTGRVLQELEPVYTNGCAVDPDGSVVWVESYTRAVRRRHADGSIEQLCTLPEGHIPDGFKLDAEGNYWITAFMGGGLDVIAPDGTYLDFLECPYVPLNCCFDGSDMWVTDFGEVTEVTAEAPMVGRLLRVRLGVQGMEPFRGSIA